jgi:hypothetical protein
MQDKNSINFAYTDRLFVYPLKYSLSFPTPTAHCPFTISVTDVRLLLQGFPRKMSQYFVTTKKWRYEILYSKNLPDISKDIRMLNYGKTFATLTPAMAVSMMKQRSRNNSMEIKKRRIAAFLFMVVQVLRNLLIEKNRYGFL